MFDLHFHSNISDGKNSIDEILKKASEQDLKFIALTDHDMISGGEFAINAKTFGINTCQSTEISTRDLKNKKSLHLTCYSKKFGDDIKKILENTVEKKQQLIIKQIEKLKEKGFKIEINDFLNYWLNLGKKIDSLNRFNISQFLLNNSYNVELAKNISGIKNMDPEIFFEIFLKEKGEFYSDYGLKYGIDVPEYEPSIEVCGALRKSNNAILSIAHPNLTFKKEGLEYFKNIFPYYFEIGVNGIEINTKADKKWIEIIYEFKNKYGIIITAGSDNHKIGFTDSKHGDFGKLNPTLTIEDKKLIIKEFNKRLEN
ncbi:MAG: PHP domain-containing protein [Candidatus Gracilibacteria bacterium]|nr:PHP domain-containing protein [Candidatus Gracilibacteria bacterium]